MPFAFGCHPGTAAVIAAIVHDRRAFGLSFYPVLPVETFIAALTRILRWRPPTGSAGHGDRVRFGNVVMPGAAVGTSTGVPPRLVTLLLRQRPLSRRGEMPKTEKLTFIARPGTLPIHADQNFSPPDVTYFSRNTANELPATSQSTLGSSGRATNTAPKSSATGSHRTISRSESPRN